MELDARKKRILKAVVEDYIQNVEPVGSKSLAERPGLDFSPATLRNEMAELTRQGYLEQPHTSAGRVPSPLGYRLYVNELMHRHQLSLSEMESINASLRLKMLELDNLLAEAGQFLASLTQYTAYTLAPRADTVRIIRFDLFAAGADAFIIVLVTQPAVVKNKLCRPPFAPEEDTLRQLSLSLNLYLVGLCVSELGEAHWEAVAARTPDGRPYIPFIVEFLQETERSFDTREVMLSGQSHLLSHPEYRDILKARRLLEYLSDRRELSKISTPDPATPVRFVIGPENVNEALQDASVIMATYHIGDNLQGMIGVVGPTRMDYARLSSHLSYFAQRLGHYLSGEEEEST